MAAVTYIFSNVPGGTSIPLSELDYNFSECINNTNFSAANISGNLSVAGSSSFTGSVAANNVSIGGNLSVTGSSSFIGPVVANGMTINGALTIDGVTVNPTGITGSGLLVLNTGPTFVAPNLGTPASGNLSNCTGLSLNSGVAGVLPIANGGTGNTTASSAINALLPSQFGQAGEFLVTDGTDVSWAPVTTGTVTSVNVSGGTTGLTALGGPINSSGTIVLGGTLDANNGGTGINSYAVGDILYADTPSTLAKLPISTTNGSILTVVSGLPSWSTGTSGPAFRATMSSTPTPPSLATTILPFNTIDPSFISIIGSQYNTTSYRFLPLVEGYYSVTVNLYGTLNVPAAGVNEIFAIIYKNGAHLETSGGAYTNPGATGNIVGTASVTTLVYMNGTTDYLEAYVYCVGTVTLNIPNNYCSWMGSYVRGP